MSDGLKVAISFNLNESKVTPLPFKSNLPTTVYNFKKYGLYKQRNPVYGPLTSVHTWDPKALFNPVTPRAKVVPIELKISALLPYLFKNHYVLCLIFFISHC
jgi:hypothetical protein